MNANLQLGRQVAAPTSPDEAILDCVRNPHPGPPYYLARYTCPEFTSLCPVTGQPDFATIVVDYVPGLLLIESKALKLYLVSFRNHKAFHEDCSIMIAKRLIEAAQPIWIRVCAFWYSRGGIPIDVFFQHGDLPVGMYVPDPGVPPYRAR